MLTAAAEEGRCRGSRSQPVARADGRGGAQASAVTSLQVGSCFQVYSVALPALDAIVPVLPGEAAIIALGVATAGSADPRIALLVTCTAGRRVPGRHRDGPHELLGGMYPLAQRAGPAFR